MNYINHLHRKLITFEIQECLWMNVESQSVIEKGLRSTPDTLTNVV